MEKLNLLENSSIKFSHHHNKETAYMDHVKSSLASIRRFGGWWAVEEPSVAGIRPTGGPGFVLPVDKR